MKELIKAWADGAQIQYYSGVPTKWHDSGAVGSRNAPLWDSATQYRIKPVHSVRYMPVMEGDNVTLGCAINDRLVLKRRYPHVTKALRVVIEPTTMTLVSAEMVDV